MTPEQIDRVFGRGRLKMATGEHVEVFREAAAPGERRRYTKRFLTTAEGDYGQWTEREWRILARLIGHGTRSVPDVVQFDRGTLGGAQQVQTYDAGATVDQWATILPVSRQGRVHRHVFEDCAHWWALAHHCLLALQEIHELHVVHLDIKGDNVCIPIGPAEFNPDAPGLLLYPRFEQLALIDFAFALVSRERLSTALPLGWETDYDYQSPRLLKALEAGRRGDLQPTRELDWRCDMYSLAAMLKRYLPEESVIHDRDRAVGWSAQRYDQAKRFILALRDAHDRQAPQRHPHRDLIELTQRYLSGTDLSASLQHGWTLARDASLAPVAPSPLTPLTRLAAPVRIVVSPRPRASPAVAAHPRLSASTQPRLRMATIALALAAVIGVGIGVPLAPKLVESVPALADAPRAALDFGRSIVDRLRPDAVTYASRGTAQGAEPTATPPQTSDQPASASDWGKEPVASSTTASESSVAPRAPETDQAAPASEADAPHEAEAPHHEAAVASHEARPAESASANAAAPVAARPATPAARSNAARAAHAASAQSRSASAPSRSASAVPARRAQAAAKSAPTFGASKLAMAQPRAARPSVSISSASATAQAVQSSLPAPVVSSESAAEVSSTTAPAPEVERDVGATETHVAESAREKPQAQEPTRAAPESAAARQSAPARPTPRIEARTPAPTGLSGLLTSLFNLARSDGKKAPMEERTLRATPRPDSVTQPPIRLAQSQPLRAPESVNSDHSAGAPASRADAVPPTPAETARAAAPQLSNSPTSPTLSASSIRPALVPEPSFTASAAQAPDWEQATSSSATIGGGIEPQEDFAALAKRLLAQSVPRTAVQAEPEVSRVLGIAARSQRAAQERDIVDAVRHGWPTGVVSGAVANSSPVLARQLSDRARQAFLSRRDVHEAFDLQLRAFGANPRDAEVAGNLAFLYLKLSPPQPELARQVAMHAMALNSVQLHATRADDWLTFAVANALIGRQDDATNALYVTIALSQDLDRSCKAALGAVAGYGERLKAPVQAMMLRLHSQGRDFESPYCNWPPRGTIAKTYF